MTRTAQVLLALVGPALGLLALPARVAAKYTREMPADIVAMRGMPVALGVCLVGVLLLRFAPVAGAAIPPAAPPLSTTCATTPTPKTMSTNVPRNSAAASRARLFGGSDG